MLSGRGFPLSKKFSGEIPSYKFGIPSAWFSIDNTDPFVFESEAVYLERHRLLSPTERLKLPTSPESFEPSFFSLKNPIKRIFFKFPIMG